MLALVLFSGYCYILRLLFYRSISGQSLCHCSSFAEQLFSDSIYICTSSSFYKWDMEHRPNWQRFFVLGHWIMNQVISNSSSVFGNPRVTSRLGRCGFGSFLFKMCFLWGRMGKGERGLKFLLVYLLDMLFWLSAVRFLAF